MKKTLRVLGIVCLVLCALFLLVALLHLQAYRNLLDGTVEHYQKLYRRAILSLVGGLLFGGGGLLCTILRSKN